jgi:hypothetical protein
MTDSRPKIRPATEDDHEAAAEALALAFADDPAWSHLLPDPASRAERLLSFFTAEIGNLAPDLRELWVAEDGSGGPPGGEHGAQPGALRAPRLALTDTFPMPGGGPPLREMWRDPR